METIATRINALTTLGIDFNDITKEDFIKKENEEISSKLYNSVINNYEEKNKNIINAAMPILKKIKKERGAVIKDVLIPFTRDLYLFLIENFQFLKSKRICILIEYILEYILTYSLSQCIYHQIVFII